jgi:hypothetical protein
MEASIDACAPPRFHSLQLDGPLPGASGLPTGFTARTHEREPNFDSTIVPYRGAKAFFLRAKSEPAEIPWQN